MKLKEREEKWVGGREPETVGPKREDGRKELERRQEGRREGGMEGRGEKRREGGKKRGREGGPGK